MAKKIERMKPDNLSKHKRSKSNGFLIKARKSYLDIDPPDILRFEKKKSVNVPSFDKYLGRDAKLHGYFEIQNSAVGINSRKNPLN